MDNQYNQTEGQEQQFEIVNSDKGGSYKKTIIFVIIFCVLIAGGAAAYYKIDYIKNLIGIEKNKTTINLNNNVVQNLDSKKDTGNASESEILEIDYFKYKAGEILIGFNKDANTVDIENFLFQNSLPMLDEGIYYNMKDNSRVGFQFTSAQNPSENKFLETMTNLLNASFVKEIDLDKSSLQETYASWSKYVLGETFVKSFTFKVTFSSDNLDQFTEELESLLPTLAVVPREFLLPREYSIGPWTYLTDETIPNADNSFVAYKNGRHARRLFLNDNQAVVTFYKKEINSLKEIIQNEELIEAIIFGDRLSFIFKDKVPFYPSVYISQKYPMFKIKSTPALENINFETKVSVPKNTEIENINALKKSQLVRYAVPIWENKLPINNFNSESSESKHIKDKYIIIDNGIINELLIGFDMNYPSIAADAEIREIAQQTQGQIIGHLNGMYQIFYSSISNKEESDAMKGRIENFPNISSVSRNYLMDFKSF